MSNKGAVKKVIESKSQPKILKSRSHSSSRSSLDSEDKNEKREKRKETLITDSKASRDKKSKTDTALLKTNVLPDKNPTRLTRTHKIEQHVSKPAVSKVQSKSTTITSVSTNKNLPSKTKTDNLSKTSLEKRTSSINMKTNKPKVERGYAEKRGESTIYMPKDTVKKVKTSNNSHTKKNSEKIIVPSESAQKETRDSLERRRSRTLSPSEVKVLKSTNTARENISKDKSLIKINPSNSNDYEYEDDFEDYESDFNSESHESDINEETDGSELSIDLEPVELHTEEKKKVVHSVDILKTEEENMLDSGHYELTEARKRAALVEMTLANHTKIPSTPKQQSLPDVKSTHQSYRDDKQPENKTAIVPSDEGFEDSRSGDFPKSPELQDVIKVVEHPKNITEKPKVLTRGQKILQMIKLDTVQFMLYESPPVTYEEFICSYGKLNAQQISTQTGEDNLDVEIQTDESEYSNKWTQFPVNCRKKLKTLEDMKLFQLEHIGVGGDNTSEISNVFTLQYDIIKLNDFVSRAGKVILSLLEEQELGGNILQSDKHDFPFSEGSINFSINSINFLCGKSVSILDYSNSLNILLSIHSPVEKLDNLTDTDYFVNCCFGCVWNTNEPSKPIKIFYSHNEITSACFHSTNCNVIFTGLEDGSISVWDLQEKETWHQKIKDKVNDVQWTIRSPTYTTAGALDYILQSCPIVSIRSLSRTDEENKEPVIDSFVSIQLCTLDESGRVIIWSVLRNLHLNLEDISLTYWGNIKLVRSQEFNLSEKFIKMYSFTEFFDVKVDTEDSSRLYVALNDTEILSINNFENKHKNSKLYKIHDLDFCGSTTCIEVCPFKKSYFLAGCSDGSIRLHSLKSEFSHLNIRNEKCRESVKDIQWSRTKPFMLYILDKKSRIIIWDLSKSEVLPLYNTSTKNLGKINCISLSPCQSEKDMKNQYLALGTETGIIEVHKLKKKFINTKNKEIQQELDTFLQYVSIL